MFTRTKLLITFLLSCIFLHAQEIDNLLHKTYAQRASLLGTYIQSIVSEKDTVKGFSRLAALALRAKKENDAELLMESKLIRAYYNKTIHTAGDEQLVNQLQNVINEAHRLGMPAVESRALLVLGELYWLDIHNYELAFESYFLLDQLLQQVPDDALPDKLAMLYRIGEAYYFFSDYKMAMQYFQRTLTIRSSEFNLKFKNAVRNTMGLSYQYLGNLDSSDYYFNQILIPANLKENPAWAGIAKGNLGYNYYLRGQYDKAVPLFQTDISNAISSADWGLAAGSMMPLADIYFKQNSIAAAEKLVLDAQEYVKRSKQYQRYQYLYPLLSKLYIHKGQVKMAEAYLDSTVFVKDSLKREFSALQLLRARQKIELLDHKTAIEKINAEKKIKTVERNVLIGFVLLGMVLAVYVYANQRKKYQQEQLLSDLQLKNKEKELEQASAQLEDFAKSISEKNQFIETLENQFGENSNIAALEQLKQATILTDAEWEKFRTLFSEVHSGYLQRLKAKLPGLTPAETRFMALAKLQLSNKEMAAVLGVSTQNIRTIWYRLRKKLNLPEEGSFEDLAGSI
jgi:DNA-binding CsgD family transcriptional regulator